MNIEQVYEKTLIFIVGSLNKSQTLQLMVNTLKDENDKKAYLYFDGEQLIFSIEGLYQYLNIKDHFTYNQYRRMLYSSELNKELSAHKVKIVNHLTGLTKNAHLFTLVSM
ncbi:MAG: hypothetical protein HRT53_13400 [Colwellia sp.]|nr:hypothetical protein [Colwellia sp.]